MKYLGIDFGGARIGTAVSDSGGRIAFPKKILLNQNNPRLGDQIKSLISEEKISEIVIGLPLALDQKETEESGEVRKFVGWLKSITAIPLVFENEVFTTRMTKHEGVLKSKADAASAAIILQSYLDKINK